MNEEDDSMEDSLLEEELEDEESSSDSVDEDIKLTKNFIDALSRIEINNSYEDYILLVDIAHDLTDLEKIRQSIQLFSSAFPLSPDIWLRYLKVETSVAQSKDELQKLIKIFKKALEDYFSIDVALEMASLAKLCDDEDAKEIWETLIPAYGYEFTKGRLMWAAWRADFIRREPESPEKYKKIAKKFKEELLLPLSHMQTSYQEFREFLDTHNDKLPNFDRTSTEVEFKTTKQILQKVLPFESKLAKLESKMHHERVDTFLKYIAQCADDLEEEYIQILYERMITACCLNETVWKEYLNYITHRSTRTTWSPAESNTSHIFLQTDLDIINRGLKNCTWSAALCVEKMRIYESKKSSRAEIQKILEDAIAIKYNSAEPIVKIWIEYLSYLVRVTDFSDEKHVEILRKNFDSSWENLGRLYGSAADTECEILRFWGTVEYTKLKDANQGRQLWNTVMESSDNYLKSALWLEFANLEHQYRNPDAARLIFKRAMKVQDLNDLPSVSSSWIRFERCYGTLEHLKYCQDVCEKALSYHRKRSQNLKRKEKDTKKDIKRKADDEEQPNPQPTKKSKESVTVDKAEFQKLSITKPKVTEESGNGDIDTSKDNRRVFLSNLDFTVTEDDLREHFPEISIKSFNMITSGKGKSRGFGYAELGSEEEVGIALKLDRRMIAGRPVFISRCERDRNKRETPFKYKTTIEPNKIFVKGVSYEATSEDLKELFGHFGNITGVRIVTHKNGNSKGIAFVDFAEAKSASTAVMKMDGKDFMGRALQVAISAPPTSSDAPPMLGGASSFHKHPPNSSSVNSNRKFLPRTEQKSRISFIPASVQKSTSASIEQPEQKSSGSAMSNDDFRKMLMK